MKTDCTFRQALAHKVPPGGQVIELGVASGEFSAALLRTNPKIGLLCGIDKWDDHHNVEEMSEALRLLSTVAEPHQCRLIRKSFSDALNDFADRSQDLIYVDGYAHTGQEQGRTLADWWPKVKPGGIFAGHDYDEIAWPQTKKAVDRFVRSLCSAMNAPIPLNVIVGDDYASWWIKKPAQHNR